MAKLKCDKCGYTIHRGVRSAFKGEPCHRLTCAGTLIRKK